MRFARSAVLGLSMLLTQCNAWEPAPLDYGRPIKKEDMKTAKWGPDEFDTEGEFLVTVAPKANRPVEASPLVYNLHGLHRTQGVDGAFDSLEKLETFETGLQEAYAAHGDPWSHVFPPEETYRRHMAFPDGMVYDFFGQQLIGRDFFSGSSADWQTEMFYRFNKAIIDWAHSKNLKIAYYAPCSAFVCQGRRVDAKIENGETLQFTCDYSKEGLLGRKTYRLLQREVDLVISSTNPYTAREVAVMEAPCADRIMQDFPDAVHAILTVHNTKDDLKRGRTRSLEALDAQLRYVMREDFDFVLVTLKNALPPYDPPNVDSLANVIAR